MSDQQDALKLHQQLQQSQWLPLTALQQLQAEQLVLLLQHFFSRSLKVHRQMRALGRIPEHFADLGLWQHWPLMTRRDVQAAGESLFVCDLPRMHKPLGWVRSSGSTGEPVKILKTRINQLLWVAHGLREHVWHERDAAARLAAIRAGVKPAQSDSWGAPVAVLQPTGPAFSLPIDTNISGQLAWLEQVQPDYLLTYPGNLAALLDGLEASACRLPALRQVRCMGETLHEPLRQRVSRLLGCSVTDTYSSQELGSIAIQCPQGAYHVMAESLLVEVLDDQGQVCSPGSIGRVVVTDLYNYATPMLRYETGDYAEVGDGCSCGRHLPTLKRILGRERNLLRVGNERRWPLVGFQHYRDIAPIRQYQLIQKSLERIEVRLVVEEPLTAAQQQQLGALICQSLGADFALDWVYFDQQLPRSVSGKFEEFVCQVPDQVDIQPE